MESKAAARPIASAPPVPGDSAAERQVRDFLGQGKWRKARDEVKPLVKRDRARYLPLLIEANLGLAREMVAKGLTEEARQVLAYLATITPAQQLVGLEVEIAARSENSGSSVGKFAAMLAEGASDLPEAQRVSLADQVVLAFAPLPAEARLGSEVRAVHEALEAVAQQQWARVPEVLRVVPRRSPFSHWVMFIKGLAAFHTGDAKRAERFFSGLPPGSVPEKAGHAYLLLTDQPAAPGGSPELAQTILDGACRLAGLGSVGRLLWRADQVWKEGRYGDSYRVLRDALAQFPGNNLDWLGSVSDFYFHAPHSMSEAQRDSYLGFFDGLLGRGATKNSIEEMRMLRMFALAEAQFGSGFDLRADWEGFLRIREQVHKSNPRLESLAYSWLGDQLSKQQPLIFLGGRGKETSLRDPQGSCECLEKAIRLDPQNLEAHLRLAKVYESLKRGSERNRLLDEMARRFSQEKLVLLENARGCIERKAFTKALDLLGRARQVDRLDPVIPELTVVARRRLAREQYQQHRPDKGRNTLAPIEEFLTDKPEDFQRSRWAAWLRHGLLEQLFGDAAQGAALLGQARAASPFPAAFLLFAHLTYRRYADPPQNSSPFLAELRTELKRDPSAAAGALLMRIFQYWDGTPDNPPLGTERDMLRNYLNVAAKRPFTRAEARAVLELCPPDQFEKQAAAFVKGVLRKDPGDPLFRLFDYMLHPTWFLDSEESRRKLRPILEEARRRGDQELVQKLQGLLRSLEHPPAMPVSPADGALDGDQDIELEEDFGQGPGADPRKPILPPELAGFTELIEMLANASEAEVRRMRKTRPKGIPNFIFDMLVEAAKRGGPTSPLMPLPHPGPSKTLGPRPTPQEDPNQRQLF